LAFVVAPASVELRALSIRRIKRSVPPALPGEDLVVTPNLSFRLVLLHHCHVTMPITYNPPTITSLPPYTPPSVPPSVIRHQRPHSQRKSLRKFRIFPYCRRFPTTDAACAHFRCSRKIGFRLGPVTPIVFTARLVAFKDMLTAAKTLHSSRTATILAKFRTLVDGIHAVRPVLVTDPLHFPSSNLFGSTFMRHSLAPDKE
jgi:hypothetical protein